eukprot:TRINITY_DN474_c0_g2_i1.p1 TRINITY_DN474_c0_g2~~TRINITY_DN474_c0_g2_i1.p1  ORF type:complete len:700 (-),score=101.36 TRINITY_DN474_c0_g2_i1:16-2115(-)
MAVSFRTIYLALIDTYFSEPVLSVLRAHAEQRQCMGSYINTLTDDARIAYFVPTAVGEPETNVTVLAVVKRALDSWAIETDKCVKVNTLKKTVMEIVRTTPLPMARDHNELLERDGDLAAMWERANGLFDMEKHHFESTEQSRLMGFVGMPGSGKTACLLALCKTIAERRHDVATLYVNFNGPFTEILRAICTSADSADQAVRAAINGAILYAVTNGDERLFLDRRTLACTMASLSLEEVVELVRAKLGKPRIMFAMDEPLKPRDLWQSVKKELKNLTVDNADQDISVVLLSICCTYQSTTSVANRVLFFFSSLTSGLFNALQTNSGRQIYMRKLPNLQLGPTFVALTKRCGRARVTPAFIALFVATNGNPRAIFADLLPYLDNKISCLPYETIVSRVADAPALNGETPRNLLCTHPELVLAAFRRALVPEDRTKLEEYNILARVRQRTTPNNSQKRQRQETETPEAEIISPLALRSLYPCLPFNAKLREFFAEDELCASVGDELHAERAILLYLWLVVQSWGGRQITLGALFHPAFIDTAVAALQVHVPAELKWQEPEKIAGTHLTLCNTLLVSRSTTEPGIEALLTLKNADDGNLVMLALQVKHYGTKTSTNWARWKGSVEKRNPNVAGTTFVPVLLTTCNVQTPTTSTYANAVVFTAGTLRMWMQPVGDCCLHFAKRTRTEEDFTMLLQEELSEDV